MKYKSKNKAIEIYWLINIIFFLVLLGASFFYRATPSLVIGTIFYFAIVLLPLALTNFNWVHPLTFQVIYEIPKVFTLATRAVGYAPLSYRWLVPVSQEQCIDSYLKCVIFTCIGLLIEYYIIFNSKNRARNNYCIQLGKSNIPAFYMLFAVICFFSLMNSLGGIAYVLLNFQDRLTEFSSDTSIYLRYSISFGMIAVYYYYLMGKKNAFITCALIQVIIYVCMGERGGIISQLVFPLFVAYQLKNGRMMSLKKLSIASIFLVLFYEVFGFIRDYDVEVTAGNMVSNLVDTFAYEPHFIISSELIYLIDSEQVDYTFGSPLLNIFFAPFPRSLFPWKPKFIGDSALVGSIILGRDTDVYGLPPSNFSWGYLNFGFIGVVLFSIISALAMKWLYVSFVSRYLKGGRTVPTGNILIYIILVGGMYAIMSTEMQIKLVFMSVGVFTLLFFAKKRIR